MTLCAKPLAGKVAIVTGGAAGIGWAITKSLVKAGARVGVFDLKSTPAEVQSDSIHFVETNITSEDSIKNAIQNIKSKWGGLDVLVNNAGIMDRMGRALPKTLLLKCATDITKLEQEILRTIRGINA